MHGVKDFVVSVVNAKLAKFNKPFLLAVLTGVHTLIFVLIIFISLMTQCQSQQMVVGGAEEMLSRVALSSEVSCIEQAQSAYFVEAEYSDEYSSGLHFCWFYEDDGLKFCSEGWRKANEKLQSTWTRPRCLYQISKKCMEPYHKHSQEGWFSEASDAELEEIWEKVKKCWSQGNADSSPDSEGRAWRSAAAGEVRLLPLELQVLMYQNCPEFVPTLGTALGYAGMIEFGVSVIIIGLLWTVGIVNTKDSQLGKWMMEYLKENATAAGKDAYTLNKELKIGNPAWTAPAQPAWGNY